MSDNQKKYEEAAKAHATITVGPEEKMIPETRSYFDACIEDFLAGASFAEKDRREEAASDQTKLWCIILELVDSPLIGQKYIDDLKSKFTIIKK